MLACSLLAACSIFQTQNRSLPDPSVIFHDDEPRPSVVPQEDLGYRAAKFAMWGDSLVMSKALSRCNYERLRESYSAGALKMSEACQSLLARR